MMRFLQMTRRVAIMASVASTIDLLAREGVQASPVKCRGDVMGHLDIVQHTVATTGP
jgi:hypothetical protein